MTDERVWVTADGRTLKPKDFADGHDLDLPGSETAHVCKRCGVLYR